MARRETISPEMAHALKSIVLTTGDLPNYQPIDIAFSTVIVGRLESEPPEGAFESVRDQLRLAAVSAGADAVMGCRFEHTVHNQQGGYDESIAFRSMFTVHGYGTLAKRMR